MFLIFKVHNISMNVQKFIYSIYAIFERMFKIFRIQQTQIVKEFTLFYTFKVRKFLKIIHNYAHLGYTIFRKIYIILQTQHTQVIEKCILYSSSVFSIYTIFQQTPKKKKKKTINSTYTNFLRMFEILHFQQT